jgi:hypothetical protein
MQWSLLVTPYPHRFGLVLGAGVIDPLASAPTPLPKSIEFHDGQLHALRDRDVDRLKEFQSPQDFEERQRLHRLAALDLLHRRAAYARALAKLDLRQIPLETVCPEPSAEIRQDGAGRAIII